MIFSGITSLGHTLILKNKVTKISLERSDHVINIPHVFRFEPGASPSGFSSFELIII